MVRGQSLLIVLCLSVFFTACATSEVPVGTDTQSSSSAEVTETLNVRYTGVIERAPAQAVSKTFVLRIADGSFVLIESNDPNLDLSSYLTRYVEVRGTAIPVGEQGTLLRVQELTLLTPPSSSSSSSSSSETIRCGGFAGLPCPDGLSCVDDASDACDPLSGGADCMGVCVLQTSSIASSQIASSQVIESSSSSHSIVTQASIASSRTSSSSSSRLMSSIADTSSVASSDESTAAKDAQTKLMAEQSYSENQLWTQMYCTQHVGGFCIPVHKNWYYRSFGATTNSLWHVEFGMSPLDSLGQGSIVLNLVSGSAAASGLPSGVVTERGQRAIGAWEWDSNHFELSGDLSLRPAIEHMIHAISPYDPSAQ